MSAAITEDIWKAVSDYLREQEKDTVNFIQIGAHDATSGDPLFPLVKEGGWRGTLFEPLEEKCEEFRESHPKSENLNVVNRAIHPEGGEKTFFVGREGTADIGSATQKSTFNPLIAEHTSEVEDMEFSRREVETIVPSKIFDYEKNPDLLLVDAEGMDSTIVSHLPLDEKEIKFIIYEDLFQSSEYLQDLADHLRSIGYERAAEVDNDLLWVLRD